MPLALHQRTREISIGPIGLEGTLALAGSSAGIVLFAHGSGSGRWGRRGAPTSDRQATLTSIFFCCCCASGVFGRVTVSTPFASSEPILSRSTPAGSENERWNEPNERSHR